MALDRNGKTILSGDSIMYFGDEHKPRNIRFVNGFIKRGDIVTARIVLDEYNELDTDEIFIDDYYGAKDYHWRFNSKSFEVYYMPGIQFDDVNFF